MVPSGDRAGVVLAMLTSVTMPVVALMVRSSRGRLPAGCGARSGAVPPAKPPFGQVHDQQHGGGGQDKLAQSGDIRRS